MFPSRRNQRLTTALLEVAEAMLRPEPADELAAAADDMWQWPARQHETRLTAARREPRQLPRRSAGLERRRAGSPAPTSHPCISPRPAKAGSDAQSQRQRQRP
jgi:hypothetical protein